MFQYIYQSQVWPLITEKTVNRCLSAEMLMLSPIQAILNVTISPDLRQFPVMEWGTTSWFLQLVIRESVLQNIPVNILETRGFVYFSRTGIYEKVVACLSVSTLNSFDYSIITAVDRNVWILLLTLVLVYAFVTKNISRAFDILWPFLEYLVK